MQVSNSSIQTNVGDSVSTLVNCWRLELLDGRVKCFTDCDFDLIISGLVYKAKSGLSTSVIESHASLSSSNLEIEGIISSDDILENDLLTGKYDSAKIVLFMVDYSDPEKQILFLKQGSIGEIVVRENKFFVEVLGMTAKTSSQLGVNFSRFCRAEFCDSRCGLEAVEHTYNGVVTKQLNAFSFYDHSVLKSVGYYSGGTLTFTSGYNINKSFVVSEYHDGNFIFYIPLESPLKQGDTYKVIEGCDKSFSTCSKKYLNNKNFRGEPYLNAIEFKA